MPAQYIGFVHNPNRKEALDLVNRLIKTLRLGDCWVTSMDKLDVATDKLSRTSTLITAGGDGTILRSVRLAAPHGIPILGINMGRVGFMAEVEVADAIARIPEYLRDGHRVEERMMLRASVVPRKGGAPKLVVDALNDVVVSRGAVARLIDVDVVIDGASLATYRADGLIVSTPTGSTGYALSAGGPVIHPEMQCLFVQPIAAHISLQTGILADRDSILELSVAEGEAVLMSVDNITVTPVGPDDKVIIGRSPFVARFLREAPPSAFYANLTRRLGVKAQTTPRRRSPDDGPATAGGPQ
ncbi:MAG: NAD(+)/NADH kinase [SAR202 cluster bacterium]|nr:NAD(+)/NADH kinase [SAR202 cluster bacterium]